MGRKHSSRLARALLALCLSTATLFAVAVGAGAAGGATSISGTVTGAGGAPLSGATVYLYSPITSEADGAVTDGSGHYLIDTLPAGDYFLSVTRAGYVTQYVDHLQLPADTPLTRDFVLTQLGSLHVTVTSVDSTPVADAAVTANGPEGSYFATPTGVGEYTIADMNPGTYTVSIGAGTVGEGQVLPQSVLVTSGAPTELSVQLLEAGGVQGIIRGPDGLPLSSGNLSLSTGLPFAPSYSAFVLPGGSYNFSNIAPGTYTMKIQPGNAAVAPATLTVVIAPGIYQLRDITLDPAASLYVNVSSATPQNPLATPASVLCPAPGDPLVLNPFPTCPGGSVGSGARTFYGPLAAGTYNVVGAYDGGPPNYLPVATSAVEAVTLGPGEVAKCSLVIAGSNSCTVGAPVTLSGNVTDGSNPLASSGGFLVCDGTFTGIGFTPCDGGSVLRFQNSDNLGNVTVAGLPGGTFEVRAYKIGAGFSVTYAAPSTVTAVPGDTITCQGAVPGATTCSTGAPSDGDGVDEPAGLDGNGDGTPDAQQPDVTTLTPAVGTGPVTIDTGDPAHCSRTSLATGVPSGGAPTVDFPVGVLGFEVTLPSGQTTADVTIHLPAGTNPTGYMKLVGNVWTPFTAITIDTSHTVSPHDLVTLHLTDNDGFDTNPAVGVIGDPGAPVVDHTT
ncbi:MAG: carboxypeptidase-like regulatory domain-containing protein [Acidimicrobiia bacterium]